MYRQDDRMKRNKRSAFVTSSVVFGLSLLNLSALKLPIVSASREDSKIFFFLVSFDKKLKKMIGQARSKGGTDPIILGESKNDGFSDLEFLLSKRKYSFVAQISLILKMRFRTDS